MSHHPAERKKHPGLGILGASGALIKYILIPLLIVDIVGRFLPGLNIDFSTFVAGSIATGIALMITGFTHGYYWKGSQQRLIAGLVGVVLTIVWLLLIVGGFNLGASTNSVSFRLSMGGMLLIIAAGVSLKAVYHEAEYRVYRKELEDEDRRRQYAPYQNPQQNVYWNSGQYGYPAPASQMAPQAQHTSQYNLPPPPPPPDENTDKEHSDSKEGIEFRPYDEITKKEDGEIEWKKPEENWKIEAHTEKSEKKKED